MKRFPSKKELKKGALAAAKAEGCVCDPDIDLAETMPNVYAAQVRHDHWCPLVRQDTGPGFSIRDSQ